MEQLRRQNAQKKNMPKHNFKGITHPFKPRKKELERNDEYFEA